jgi:hypothetical protein
VKFSVFIEVLQLAFLLDVCDALDCIEPPTQVPKDIRSRIEGEVTALRKVLGSGNFVVQTEVLARNLYADYPNSDRITIAQMLLSSICRLLSSLKIPDAEKVQRYQETEECDQNLWEALEVSIERTQRVESHRTLGDYW